MSTFICLFKLENQLQMLNKGPSIALVAIFLLFNISIQQLTVPLLYEPNKEQSESSSIKRHHLLSQSTPNQHKKLSRLSHNIEFIKNYGTRHSAHSSHNLHNLNTESETDHLRL